MENEIKCPYCACSESTIYDSDFAVELRDCDWCGRRFRVDYEIKVRNIAEYYGGTIHF